MPPPIYPPDLLDVIEGFTAGPFDGEVYRHMFNDYSPSRVNVYGARWNPPEVAALYTSLQRETCLAEAEHAIAIQPLRPRAKRTLYRVHVRLSAVVSLSTAEDLRAVGLDLDALRDDDHSRCRLVGGAVKHLGHDGLLVPSARADGVNLVIFPSTEYELEIIDHEIIEP